MITQHREHFRRQDAKIVADIDHDQLDQAAGVHQGAKALRFPPVQAGPPRRGDAAAHLAGHRDRDDPAANHPRDCIVQQADLGAQPGECEKQRQQDKRPDILDGGDQLRLEARSIGHDDTGKEGAEDRMNAYRLGQ
jgi:hypothetical protein